jgi:hypothetical protein
MKNIDLPVLTFFLTVMAGVPPAVAQARPELVLSTESVNPALASMPFQPSGALLVPRSGARGVDPLVNDTWKGGTGNWSGAANWSAGVAYNGTPADTTHDVSIDGGSAAHSAVTPTIARPFTAFTCPAGGTCWVGGTSGAWSTPGNWSNGVPTNGTNVLIDNGNANAQGASTVTLDIGGAQAANVTVDADDRLSLNNNTSLTVNGTTISNAGGISLNSAGNLTDLILAGNNTVTLSGGGTVTLGNNPNNRIYSSGGGGRLVNQETIQGGGQLGVGQTAITNSGTINANVANELIVAPSGSGVTNTGTMEASGGGTLDLRGGYTNTGGLIEALAGSTVAMDGATINGGTLTTSGGGLMESSNPSSPATFNGITLSSGSTYTLPNNTSTVLQGTITNKGNFQLSSAGNLTDLRISGPVTLTGGGTVTMDNNPNNRIYAINGTDTLTNGETIQGAGQLGVGLTHLINNGTILANQPTPLLVQSNAAGITNSGTLSVSASDLMHVSGGPLSNFAGTSLTGGTYNVTGTLQIDELGSSGGEILTNAANIVLDTPASIFIDAAGKDALTRLNTNATNGHFTLMGGRNFTTAGSFTNNGTLTVGAATSKFDINGSLVNFSGTTLTGGNYNISGTLQFNNANIVTNAANITLTGTSSKIINQSGANGLGNFATNAATGSFTVAAGRVFATSGAFTNSGSLTMTGAGSQFTTGSAHFTNGGTLTISGGDKEVATGSGAFTNTGTLSVAAGSTLALGGALTNLSGTTLSGGSYDLAGTFQFPGANIVSNAANITLMGATSKILNSSSSANGLASFATNTSTGTFSLSGGGALTTAGAFSNAGTLAIGTGSTFAVGGLGSFVQTAGRLTDDGTLSTSGSVTLSGGSLFGKGLIKGALQSSAVITPGDSATSTGILTDSGAFKQNSGGTLDISIGGTTPGAKFDELNSTTANLAGTLNIKLINSFVPALGASFKVLNFNSETGKFTTVNGLAINGSEHFAVTYQGSDVLLTVVSGAASAGTAITESGAPGGQLRSPRLDLQPVLASLRLPATSPATVERSSSMWASSGLLRLTDTANLPQTSAGTRLGFVMPVASTRAHSLPNAAGTPPRVSGHGRIGKGASGHLQFSLLHPLSVPAFFFAVE